MGVIHVILLSFNVNIMPKIFISKSSLEVNAAII